MIDQSELNPNQFPAWAEFTPSSESLTKVSAREGFQIDLGNPLTLEDLSLTSLGVSGLTTLHDIDIKDSSETVILQRNGSALETLVNQGGTPTMSRIGSGIIESSSDDSSDLDTFGNGHVYRPNADRYELFGVARFNGTDWYLIDDTGHTPYGIASIENLADGGFRIYYDKVAGHVGTLIAVPDETYARAGVIAGASVGDEYADVIMSGEYLDKTPSTKMAFHLMRSTTVFGYITYNGTSWVHSSSSGITSLSFDSSSGLLTVTHSTAGGICSITGRDNSYDRPVFASYSTTTTIVKFYGHGRIPNSNLELSGSNIWLYGKMHAE